ncbi:TetR/AcrR family transcriptional regulator [Actinospica sp.]|uniref:TetR/AcrR family transcriptional regulator n=1 Tax=Actinospica sp. TaxID=1872142 RepID=UPI002D1D086A|nr:TetR/AcrR family transcriptional regulator [Actinospica sp.]HWG28526.1 TetR/AcrR family transcriptional regulator [Actinospica sp.]
MPDTPAPAAPTSASATAHVTARAASRRLAPSERRRQILDTARELLDTETIDEISVEAVAKHVGVSPGLLFHYFGSQRRFRHAVLQAAARELLKQVAPDPALSPMEQLHMALERFTDYVHRNPSRYLAVVRFASANRELRNLHSSLRAVFGEWLIDGLGSAGVPATQPVRASIAGWLAFVEEVLLTWLDDPQMPQEEVVTLCERACYVVIEVAVADPALWSEIQRRVTRRPADS